MEMIMEDLFEKPEAQPKGVRDCIETFERNYEAGSDLYSECRRLEVELFQQGYEFDWGLDGVPYNLREIKK